ncbi:hypothetical protein TRFO_28889 [Tritrichomonas foetus]|uniref:Serine/threonine-protein phosphatase 4 regulatory subunit 3-like central domain-containing protein n=1 Tax=Tritrichomonas foetus TaxID=1144522 RepID=A0A1J4JWW6_9EUKA|nr:hypothetical protein TRFO_28889 [Tritrichomonas foetus]|eukprot:OHT03639.1 hypothetical protein TRFO_28889 [Tritrichomonas foetus]
MISYKEGDIPVFARRKDIFSLRNDDQIFVPTKNEEQNNYFNLYQQLFSTNPNIDPQMFCVKLNELTNLIKRSSNFEYKVELHHAQFFKDIVSLLNLPNKNVVSSILNFLDQILKFKGPIEAILLETDLVETMVQIFKEKNQFCNIELNILRSLSVSSRCFFDPNAPKSEGLDRIFNQVSIDEIFDVVAKLNDNENHLMKTFYKFLYSITSFELNSNLQNFILAVLSEKYDEEEENLYHAMIHILSNMTKYQTFILPELYNYNLHKFIVDMVNTDSLEHDYISPALQTISNICSIKIPDGLVIPKIQTPIEERIFNIAGNLNLNEHIRVAAFDALRCMISSIKQFQRFEDSVLHFLYEKWVLIIEIFDNTSFKIKASIIKLIVQLTISASNLSCYAQNSLFIQELINRDIIRIFVEAIELNDSSLMFQGILGLKIIIEQCENYGCEGFFEYRAKDELNIELINNIIDHCPDKTTRRQAVFLHSHLVNLPNRLFAE